MNYSHYIGVDISKNTLDAAIYAASLKRSDTKHLTNDKAGLKDLVNWAKAAGAKPKDMLICAEHAGVYGNELQVFCEKKGIALCLESPLQIKHSMGLVAVKMTKLMPFVLRSTLMTTRINSRSFIALRQTSSPCLISCAKGVSMCVRRPL